jgi:transcriptional regulator with XRE-family HTH domain
MEIHARIKQLLAERGWTEYRLSRECGLAQTTIVNLVRRNTLPSMATLETICKGFRISMAQFFAEGDMLEVTPELKEVFDCWVSLTPDQKKAALAMLKAMNHDSLQ